MPPPGPGEGGALTTLAPQRERALLWLLALTQFTIIMDFMIMMPLGPQIMTAFVIGPAAFATAVSAYSWCAGLSGLFAATYIDRFDRKKLLLVVYVLFALSNLACALAQGFLMLQAARAFAGLTAGVLGSIVMAVLSDVIPQSRRGAAAGIVMTSFSLAAVFGVPVGILLGAHFGWESPFYLLAALSALIWIAALRLVPTLTGHLRKHAPPLAQVLPELFALVRNPLHVRAFLLTAMVMSASMLVIPFMSPVLVANHGILPAQLSWMYMAGGVATFFTARIIGRLSDRFGAVSVSVLSLCAAVPFLALSLVQSGWVSVALLLTGSVLLAVQNAPGVVLAQAMLPRNLGMALGLMNGVAFGVGSAAVTGVGFLLARVGPTVALLDVSAVPLLSAVAYVFVARRLAEEKLRSLAA